MKWETALWMVACSLLASLPRGQLDTTCHAFVGETVVLPCTTTTTPLGKQILSRSMLYWQIGTKKLVHFFQNGHDSLEGQDKNFHNRTSLFLDQMEHGNLSLKISQVQLEDEAEYSCIYRQTENHQTTKSTVKLYVSDSPGKDSPGKDSPEEPPSPSEQNQVPSGSPTDVPCLLVTLLSFLLLVPLGLWHL